MKKGYQHNYSLIQKASVHDEEGRIHKAITTLKVLEHYFKGNTGELDLLDIGASTGIIDNHLSDYFKTVTGVDIDEPAITFAQKSFNKDNLKFRLSDAMKIDEADESFDVILCSHVYEHVPDQNILMDEIYRLLKKGGVCYFSAGNRLNIMEPHYKLPFLSIIPHFMAHIYLRVLGKGKYYYEEHKTYWGLKKLVCRFRIYDYTRKIVNNPAQYEAEYMLPMESLKLKTARIMSKYCYWLFPGYVWLLEKTDNDKR